MKKLIKAIKEELVLRKMMRLQLAFEGMYRTTGLIAVAEDYIQLNAEAFVGFFPEHERRVLDGQDEWLKRQLYTALLDEMDQWPIPMSEARKKRIEILEKMKANYRRFKGLE